MCCSGHKMMFYLECEKTCNSEIQQDCNLSIKALTLAKGDSGNIGSALLDANSIFMKMAIWLLSGIRQSGRLISFISFGSFVFFAFIPGDFNSFGHLCAFTTKDYSI